MTSGITKHLKSLTFCTVIFLAVVSQFTFAQSNDILAKSYFLKAQEAYTNNKNQDAVTHLDKTVEYLGSTNAKIEALYVKAFLKQKDYVSADEHLKRYFETADESRSDYMEMIKYVAEVKEKKEIQEKKFVALEKAASFPGGNVALKEFISQNLKYPEEAKSLQIEGRVLVSFSIAKDGSTENIKAIKGPGFGLGKEAVRLIQSMPKWKPAIQKGKPVTSKLVLPITFKL